MRLKNERHRVVHKKHRQVLAGQRVFVFVHGVFFIHLVKRFIRQGTVEFHRRITPGIARGQGDFHFLRTVMVTEPVMHLKLYPGCREQVQYGCGFEFIPREEFFANAWRASSQNTKRLYRVLFIGDGVEYSGNVFLCFYYSINELDSFNPLFASRLCFCHFLIR